MSLTNDQVVRVLGAVTGASVTELRNNLRAVNLRALQRSLPAPIIPVPAKIEESVTKFDPGKTIDMRPPPAPPAPVMPEMVEMELVQDGELRRYNVAATFIEVVVV